MLTHKSLSTSIRNRRNAILRMRREGYKIWKIAKAVEADADFVAATLVREGILTANNVMATMNAEREPDKESIAARLRRMRRVRKNANQNRRIGGGNWSGR